MMFVVLLGGVLLGAAATIAYLLWASEKFLEERE